MIFYLVFRGDVLVDGGMTKKSICGGGAELEEHNEDEEMEGLGGAHGGQVQK